MFFLNALLKLSQWLQNTFIQQQQFSDREPSNQFPISSEFRHTVERVDTPMQQTKVLTLGEQTLWLLVKSEEDNSLHVDPHIDRVSIRVRLGAAEPRALLPAGVRLSLLSRSGDVVQSVTARDHDNGIQLRRFCCPVGTQFALQVSLDAKKLD